MVFLLSKITSKIQVYSDVYSVFTRTSLIFFSFLTIFFFGNSFLSGKVYATCPNSDCDHLGADFSPANGTTISGTHINIGIFTVASGTTVTASSTTSISATTVNIAGTLSANGTGSAGETGTGKGAHGTGSGSAGGGAGYGGNGGNSNGGNAGGNVFGSVITPTDLGSGGGNISATLGGAGGGYIRLIVSGTLTIPTGGVISANGGDSGLGAGGGSGGSIYITAGTFAGNGTISANGGTATANGTNYGGGGGGGRIAVYYTTKTYSGAFTVIGGNHTTAGQDGGGGTIYQKANTQTYGDLAIMNTARSFANNRGTPLPNGTYNFNNITLNNNAYFIVSAGMIVTVDIGGTLTGAIMIDNIAGGTLSLANVVDMTVSTTSYLNGTFALRDVSVSSGQTLYLNSTMTTRNITVASTGVITSQSSGTLSITASGDVSVTGTIQMNALGSAAGAGTGAGTSEGGSYGASGGGYGGYGGFGVNGSTGGGIYGSVTAPTDLGSGGGSGSGAGGSGGGAIRLIVTGTLTVNSGGVIGANGGDTAARAGGGSGGSVYITTGAFAGAGSVTSNGGHGVVSSYNPGGGGGGRIAIYYTTKTFSGTLSAIGGVNGGSYNGVSSQDGSGGTIYLKGSVQTNGDLTIMNTARSMTVTRGTPLPNGTYTYDNIYVNNNGYLLVTAGMSLTAVTSLNIGVTGFRIDNAAGGTFSYPTPFDLTIAATSYLKGVFNIRDITVNSGQTLNLSGSFTPRNITVASTGVITNTLGTNLNITASGDVNITGSIQMDGLGNGAGLGTGAGGLFTGSHGGGGAGYGGYGGNGYSSTAGGTIYGSITSPTDLGSGGGYATGNGAVGGSGGGALRLIVTGTLTVQSTGVISSNGNNGAGTYGGGGSGGSVYITAGTFAGSGSIAANGGSGAASDAGGGSGGRIAIYYTSKTYTGAYNAIGGALNGTGQDGSGGTIYLKSDAQTNGDLTIMNTGRSLTNTRGTPLPNGTYTYDNLYVNNNGYLLVTAGMSVTAVTSLNIGATGFRIDNAAGGTFSYPTPFDLTAAATSYLNGAFSIRDITVNTSQTLNLNGSFSVRHVTVLSSAVITNNIGTNLNIIASGDVNITGTIQMNGLGNGAGLGTGAGGLFTGSHGGGGAGYGGYGGNGYSSTAGGTIYGSITSPTDLGSGGGYATGNGAVGGSGGGALRLIVTGTLTVQSTGVISSNGNNGAGTYGGGGSGGSVYITAGTFAGSGSIAANGGSGAASDAGGGSGGRIAIYYTSKTYTGAYNAIGGALNGTGQDGSGGTIYLKSDAQTNGDLTIMNTGRSLTNTRGTPLPNGTYTYDNLNVNNNGYLIVAAVDFITATAVNLTTGGRIDNITTGTFSCTTTCGSTITSGTLILNGSFPNLSLTINSGATFSPHNVTLTNLTVISGGIVSDSLGSTLTLTVSGDLNNAGTIQMNALGNAGGAGTGVGAAGSGGSGYWNPSGGGGYGGKGGNGYNNQNTQSGGGIYGSITAPVDLGSGGGNTGSYSGGSGGGAMRLIVSGTLTNTGTISSNGGAGTVLSYFATGGGSGGSVYITTGTLAGNGGNVNAIGGAGATGYGPGGGGGRIAIYYTNKSYTGNYSAAGGTHGGSSADGGAGTVFLKSGSQTYGDLTLDNGAMQLQTITNFSNGTYTFDSLAIKNNAYLEITAGTILTTSALTLTTGYRIDNIAGGTFSYSTPYDLTVTGTAYLNGSFSIRDITINSPGTLNLNNAFSIRNLTVNTGGTLTNSIGGTLNVTASGDTLIAGTMHQNYMGSAGGSGTGVGVAGYGGSGNTNSSGGGGYGGKGGFGNGSQTTQAGGSTYGSLTAPTDLGSGGGNTTGTVRYGGSGGGAIRLIVSGTLTVSGTISSNGGNGTGTTYWFTGGGSGGSVYITTGTFAGSGGNINAIGGTGVVSNGGGAGGGGRIAIYYTSKTYSGAYSAAGGTHGSNSADGGAGTVYLKSGSQTYGDLILDNDAKALTTITNFPNGTYTFDSVAIKNNTYFQVTAGTILTTSAATFTASNIIDNIAGGSFSCTGACNPIITSSIILNGTFTFDTLTVNSGGIVSHSGNGTTQTNSLTINALSVTVNTGGSINVDGKGFQAGYNSTGAGTTNGGGGYGGRGGNGSTGTGGNTYGSDINPVAIGSSAASGTGLGGGYLKLNLTSTLTVNSTGTISAKGSAGSGGYGGGSGGSINIVTATMAGNGTITAAGGNGSASGANYGGGGGGGRISYQYTTNNSTGTITVAGGTKGGGTAQDGSIGTINTQQVGRSITNVPSGLTAVLTSDWSTDVSVNPQIGIKDTGVINSTNRIAIVNINFDNAGSWSGLVADSTNYKSIFYYPAGLSALPGITGSTLTLYVPKDSYSKVGICPSATSLATVSNTCTGVYYLDSGSGNVSVVTENSVTYWKITGLANGGGFSAEAGLVTNLPGTLTAYLSSNWSTNVSTNLQSGVQSIGIAKSTTRLAIVSADLTNSVNWANIVADNSANTSIFYYPGGISSLPGVSGSTYTLYVPKGSYNKVAVCPNATQLSEVISTCSGVQFLDTSNGNVTTATENGTLYWKIANMTNGGAVSTYVGLITNLPAGLSIVRSSDWTTDVSNTIQTGTVGVGIKKGAVRIASFNIDFSVNRNFSSVVANTSSTQALFYYPGGFTSLPGNSGSTYSLYVPKNGENSAAICPDATTLTQVASECSNITILPIGDSRISTVNIGGTDYWLITGMTNGGAFTTSVGTITSTPPTMDVVIAANPSPTADILNVLQEGVKEVTITNTTDIMIVDFNVDFTTTLNWSGVTALTQDTTAVFHYAGGITAVPGSVSATYSLYVPKGGGDKVWICPGASTLGGVSLSCPGGYFLSAGQTLHGATASVETNGGVTYWKITGLTGTGAMSVITGLTGSLNRAQVLVGSNHTLTFGTNNGLLASTDTIVVTFDPAGQRFDLTGLTISDIELTDNVSSIRTLALTHTTNTWGVAINTTLDTITFTAPTSGTGYYPSASQVIIKIGTNAIGGVNQIKNPVTPGSYAITITLNNTGTEAGDLVVAIVDSDRVNITGYVTAYIYFDIDTNTDNSDCAYNVCLDHEGGTMATNYTVDLGELKSTYVNKSQLSVDHNGTPGKINSIYFDLTTNGISGAVVQVRSQNGGLQGPGGNFIPSVSTDGLDIASNSGQYGYNLPIASTAKYGTVTANTNCDSAVKYCGALNTGMKDVFTTGGNPIDSARVRMDVAAGATYTDNPGVYTDTLTFIATTTF